VKGGVIDEFIIQIFDPIIEGFVKDILIAFLTYYFTKRANKRDNILKGIEIIEKIKEKNYRKKRLLPLLLMIRICVKLLVITTRQQKRNHKS